MQTACGEPQAAALGGCRLGRLPPWEAAAVIAEKCKLFCSFQLVVAASMACQAFCNPHGINNSMQALGSSLDIAH